MTRDEIIAEIAEIIRVHYNSPVSSDPFKDAAEEILVKFIGEGPY